VWQVRLRTAISIYYYTTRLSDPVYFATFTSCYVVDRQKVVESYQKQAEVLFQQWDTDLEKTRENEEILQVVNMTLVDARALQCCDNIL